MIALFFGTAALATTLGVALPTDKVRPGFPVPDAAEASLDVARGGIEAFQIVVHADGSAVSGVSATASDLVGPGTIPASEVRLYRVGLYTVVTPSNSEGARGEWPDPLIPDVDTVAGEHRNAFPFDVPAGESRAIWVDVRVSADVPAGVYTGEVDVDGIGNVPITLRVHDVAVPATSSLVSAFGMGWDRACVAHEGSYDACGGDAGIERYHTMYAAFALDYRVTLSSVVYYGPDGDDWSRFDRVYSPLLDGTAPTWTPGAKLTSIQLMTEFPATIASWSDHFAAMGWKDRLFQYTCDEPPNGCSFADIPDRAALAHAEGIRTLATTDIANIDQHGLADDIDIAVPIVNYVDEKDGPDRRDEYEPFLSREGTSLWWYQSCMSHGCGGGETTDPYFTGWPSMMIDASGVQNRAFEWLSFRDRIAGELYFATDDHLVTAWDDQFAYGGNGDGTLFYPGRPDIIGGSTDVPVASQRLALIRAGMEDYELLAALEARGGDDAAYAEDVARGLFPEASEVAGVDGAALMDARKGLLDRLAPMAGDSGDSDTAQDSDGSSGKCGCGGGGSAMLLPAWAWLALRRRRSRS
jgi:hypothetical protein